MQKLYDSRVRNGDITFVFKDLDEGKADLEIPVPAHDLAESGGAANDVEMRDENEGKDDSTVRVKCHRQVLLAHSEYFRGLMEFNHLSSSEDQEVTLSIHDHSPKEIEAMIEFLYLGEAKVNSNDLVDLLGLC